MEYTRQSFPIAILTGGNAIIHTVGSAMRVTSTTGGLGLRIFPFGGTPKIESPMIWFAGTDAPRTDPNDPNSDYVSSISGADMFVETDCDMNGCDGVAAGEQRPHLMVYSNNCSAGGPWFDSVRGVCR